MNPNESNKILANIDKLIGVTDCNGMFLAALLAKSVLSITDIDQLTTIHSKLDKSFAFYQIILTRSNAYAHLLHALHQTRQSKALQFLREEATIEELEEQKMETRNPDRSFQKCDDDGPKVRSVSFGFLVPSSIFSGREDELKELHAIITGAKGGSGSAPTVITSISGLGGIGKTQLARKYADIYGSWFDHNVMAIDAASTESLNGDFRRLASDVLRISIKNADGDNRAIASVVTDVYHHFSSASSKSLFILDNAEMGDYLKPYLPPPISNKRMITVLITSRDREWGEAVKILELKVFKEVEAINFVKECLGIDEDGEAVDREVTLLARTLHYFPLALRQAISYIKNQRVIGHYSILEYIEELKVRQDKPLDRPVVDDLYDDYSKTTFSTWEITLEKVSQQPQVGPIAIEILKVVSYFEPDTIPRDSLLQLEKGAWEEEEETEVRVKLAVKLLAKYSLVDGYQQQQLLSVHRLVQHVVRIGIEKAGQTDFFLARALSIFEVHLNETNLSHAVSVWKHGAARQGLTLIPKCRGLALKIICEFKRLRWLDEGSAFGEDVLKWMDSSSSLETSDDSSELLTQFEEELSACYRLNNHFEQALTILRRVLGRQVARLGHESKDALWTRFRIGLALFNQGSYSEGFTNCHSAAQSLENILGETDKSALAALSRAGEMAVKVGQFELGQNLLQRALAHQKDNFGPKHIDVLVTRLRLGILAASMGSPEGLETLSSLWSELDSIPNPTREQGEVLQLVLTKYAEHCLHFGQSEEAHAKSLILYETYRAQFGEAHITTLLPRDLIGSSLLRMGNPLEAHSIQAEIYSLLKERWGIHHFHTLRVLGHIGQSLSQQGKHLEAISTYIEVFNGLEGKLDGDSIDMLELKFYYAEALGGADCVEPALQVLEQVRSVLSNKFGERPPLYRDTVQAIQQLQNTNK